MGRAALLALITISAVGLLGTAGVVSFVDYFAGDLPPIEALQSTSQPQTTRILDRNGALIEAVYHENRTVEPLSKMAGLPLAGRSKSPDNGVLVRATVDTEDRTFFQNSGVDYRRLAIAMVTDLTNKKAALGASTITEQVVKNDVLTTEEARSKTISRKLRELVLAEELERRYSKDQILELYLNTINYGNGAYGAEAAAETYFQVHASDLNLEQASFIAGLPQAPGQYDPFGTPDQLAATKARWQSVLNGMVAVGDITRAEADKAFNSDLIAKMTAAYKASTGQRNPLTAHFVDYIKAYVIRTYGEKALYEGGLQITTTLDLATQASADKWVKAGVAHFSGLAVNTGAMLVMKPNDGEILAMVGSADYNNAAIRGQVNITGADGWLRPVGSTFKVYTYGAALEAGLDTAATPMNDANGTIGNTTFHDWDGKTEGWITLRQAIMESRNLPALYTYKQVGGDRVMTFYKKLGNTSPLSNPDGLSTTLGQDSISLVEHLAAYSAFANGGYKVSAHSVLKITDASGKHVLETLDVSAARPQVISPELAYLMTDLLKGPLHELGNPFLNSKPVAGKSGTGEAYTSTLWMGYTPDLAVATTMTHIDAGDVCLSGYAANATSFPPSGWICPTGPVSSIEVGAKVWAPFVQEYYATHPWPAPWAVPPGIVTRSVCSYDGGYTTSGGYSEVFLKGIGEPSYPCGANPPPGAGPPPVTPKPTPPPVTPTPSPVPSPSPSPSVAVSPSPTTSPPHTP